MRIYEVVDSRLNYWYFKASTIKLALLEALKSDNLDGAEITSISKVGDLENA